MGKKKIIKIFKKSAGNFIEQYKILEKDFSEKNIHNFRVSYRRLKSIYNFFQLSGFNSEKELKKRTKKIFDILGEMRDYQVNLNLLENMYFPKKVPADVKREFEKIKEEDMKKLIKILRKNKKKIFKLLEKDQKKIIKYIQYKDKNELASDFQKIREELKTNVESSFKNLSEEVKTYHNLRLAVKKYRYFLENFEGILGNVSDEYKELKNIQDLLGEINDLDVLDKNLSSADLAEDENLLRFLHTRLQNKINEFRIIF